jgi:uncharacterized protein involved in exopolysaccharide biosynthesis
LKEIRDNSNSANRRSAASGESDSDLSVRDMIAPLFRRKRLIIVVFLSVFGFVVLLAAVKGPAFASHMAILVNRERLDPLVSTEATTQMISPGNPVTAEEINSEVELLKSRDLLEQVVLANGLAKPSEGFSLGKLLHPDQSEENRIARAVKGMASQLKIEAKIKTNIIEIAYSSSDPRLSYGVLKSLGDLYAAKHEAVHRPAGSYQFFAKETQKYHDELENAESKLRQFGKQNGVAAPEEQRTNLALQAANSVGLQHLAEQSIAADEERIRNDQKQIGVTPPRAPTTQASSAADRRIDDLNASLLAAQTKRSQLAVKYDPSYPLMQEADLEINQIKVALSQAEVTRYVTETTDRDPTFELLREDIVKSQADLAAQRANLNATGHSIHSIQGQMVKLDQLSIEQQDLLRDAKAAENNYLLYLAKREQELTTDALDRTRIANVAIAVPPAIPVLPVFSWPVIILMASGAAVFLSFGTAYLVDYTDSSFHNPAQVIDMMGIPVVISVSKKTA